MLDLRVLRDRLSSSFDEIGSQLARLLHGPMPDGGGFLDRTLGGISSSVRMLGFLLRRRHMASASRCASASKILGFLLSDHQLPGEASREAIVHVLRLILGYLAYMRFEGLDA